MFRSKGPALAADVDYTGTLREAGFYKYGHLRNLGLSDEVTALAVDPLLSLLAVGTANGAVHVYGCAPFQFTLPCRDGVDERGAGIKFIAFHPGHARLVVVDDSNNLSSFALNNITDDPNPSVYPPLPKCEASHAILGEVTAIEQPLPSYTHMFLTLSDGVTLAWDLRQRELAPFRLENLWAQYEERLVRSGVPGRSKTLGGPRATCIAMNPRDLNIMLVGYEGGVVAWDFQKGTVAKTFELVLPPGAPGGGSYQDDALWTERRPIVTCVVWRPDGLAFVVGHADGCMAFWAYDDADKPFMVRTLTHEDVNVPDAEALMDAGVLDAQLTSQDGGAAVVSHEIEGMPVLSAKVPAAKAANREPIYKLAWAGFPEPAQLKVIAAAAGADGAGGVPLAPATTEYAERGETLIVVLGGQSPNERPGINMLQLPAFTPPPTNNAKKALAPSDGLGAAERKAFRDSLAPTGTSLYPTKTPPEDFTLLPRSNPYFGMAHDAVAIFVLLTPDARLSRPPGGASLAARQLDAYAFPPPRSTVPPLPLGRRNYVTPEAAPAPARPPSQSSSAPSKERVLSMGESSIASEFAPTDSEVIVVEGERERPHTQRSTSNASWRFPWTASTSSASSPSESVLSLGSVSRAARRRLRVPSQIWSGGLSVFGTRIEPLPTPTFTRLIQHAIETEGAEHVPRVPLRGGMAVPDLHSHGAPTAGLVRAESYRVLVTWHADATVRFWDISPQTLVLPTPLRFEYPSPLPHLTFSIGKYLRHPDVAHLPLAKLWASDRSQVRITDVRLARETLELVITFASGEVVVAKFAEAMPTPDAASRHKVREGDENSDDDEVKEGSMPEHTNHYAQKPSARPRAVDEITEIDHLASWTEDGFKPRVIFTVRRGRVLSTAVSDVGFIAVAYEHTSLAILDMRGPDIILREGFTPDGATLKKRARKGDTQNVPAEQSAIGAMKWVISGIGGDHTLRPRLVVSYAKGTTKIYCLTNVGGEWTVDARPPTFQNDSLANPVATFVLDPATGEELRAAPDQLAESLSESAGDGKWTKEAPPHLLWVAACKRAIRVAVNFNGERVAKVEFDRDELANVFYITRNGLRVIVALTTRGTAMFYSAPHLEYITSMDLYFGSRSIGALSFDDRSGDFIEFNGPLNISLRTLFNFRKPFPPRIDPCSLRTPAPAQPQPLSASYFGWMWGSGPLTGAQLDAIVAGPNRGTPPPAPPAPRRSLLAWGDPPTPPTSPPKTAAGSAPAGDGAQPAQGGNDIYTQLRDGLNRRTEMLGMLGEQVDATARAASNYAAEARKMAQREAAKNTTKGFFGKVW